MSRQRRIFIEASVLSTGHLSGVGHALLFWLQALAQPDSPIDRSRIVLLLPFGASLVPEVQELGFRLKRLPIGSRGLRLLRKYNALPAMDVFVGRGIYVFPNYWNWPLLRSKNLTFVYDISFLTHAEFTNPRNQRFLSAHIKSWIARADRLATMSRFSRTELITRLDVPAAKIGLTVAGIAPPQILSSDVVARYKQQLGVPGEYVLFVGNIEPRKNLVRLISAYEQLPADIQRRFGLVLIGGDGWNNQLILDAIKRAQDQGLIVIHPDGFVDDAALDALYAGATALIHPALLEGFGLTPLEAMARGVPVIVANTSSLPEIVGNAGLYVDPDNAKDISDKLKLVLTDASLRVTLATKGRRQAEFFSRQRAAQDFAEQIEQLEKKS